MMRLGQAYGGWSAKPPTRARAACSLGVLPQVAVAADVTAQVAGGSRRIMGVMVESHLMAGRQSFTPGADDPAGLAYGQSITDGCLGWDESVAVLEALDGAVRARRARQ